MPDPSNPSPPRSGLSPAAWAAISAIAVAVVGAVVTLITTWWTHPPAKPSPEKPAAQVAEKPAEPAAPADSGKPTAPDLSALAGRWAGTAQASGQPAQRIEVEITRDCAPGARCGWIAVPSVPCRGELSLVGPVSEGLEFQVDRFDSASDPQRCQPGGGEVLRAAGDGTVVYTATYSGARGTLRRAP